MSACSIWFQLCWNHLTSQHLTSQNCFLSLTSQAELVSCQFNTEFNAGCILKGQFDFSLSKNVHAYCGLHNWFLPLKFRLEHTNFRYLVTVSSLWHCCKFEQFCTFTLSHTWQFINEVRLTNRWHFFLLPCTSVQFFKLFTCIIYFDGWLNRFRDTLYFVSFNLWILFPLLSLSTRSPLPNASPIYRIRDCTAQLCRSVMFVSNAGVLRVCLHSPTNLHVDSKEVHFWIHWK